MIGKYVREIAQEVCQGKSADLIASGYNQEVLPFAWSALISGLLELDVDLSDFWEKQPPVKDARYNDTKEVVAELKLQLKQHWKCMQ